MHDIFDLIKYEENLAVTTVDLVKKFCKTWNISGYHALLETNVFAEENLADFLSKNLKLPRIYSISEQPTGKAAREHLNFEKALTWECIPHKIENNKLEIVMADPTQRERIDYLRKKLDLGIEIIVGERGVVLSALNELYPLNEQIPFF